MSAMRVEIGPCSACGGNVAAERKRAERAEARIEQLEEWLQQLRETRPIDQDDACWIVQTFADDLLKQAVDVLREYARPFGYQPPRRTFNPAHPWDEGQRAREFLNRYGLTERLP